MSIWSGVSFQGTASNASPLDPVESQLTRFLETHMKRTLALALLCLFATSSMVAAQNKGKPKPNINESKEYPNVVHSPSAESTPPVFRSVLQMEIVIKDGDAEPAIRYADGVVVGKDGLLACVVDAADSKLTEESIEGADVLLLDKIAVAAELVKWDAAHGLALFRAKDLNHPALALSKRTLVAKRRLTWHCVYRDGRRTILYTRPLQVHKSKITVGTTEDLCEVIDYGTSALGAERSGSALLSLDGQLVALMGRQPHWNVAPKNVRPRTKTAIAVPASVVAAAIESATEK